MEFVLKMSSEKKNAQNIFKNAKKHKLETEN